MPIIPDEKDWTWVLSEPCNECGFDPATVTPSTVPGTVLNMLPRWRAVLRREDVAVRPNDHTWSTLEYACHVRDVFSLFDQRLNLMLTEDDAQFANWNQDQAAIDGEYGSADPRTVADELETEGATIAESFARVSEEEWVRTGTRSNGSAFTVLTFSQYFLHDVVHHLHDVDG
ncbi:DinB family protein [Paenarthrobacter sp. AR 02]|uniref:DinB family protein n=1 Tax=Paenarthrobacter sp. AR 02 TaxID=2899821 RepID=UPI001F287945|nr:DinB family protein [Paenarthrobacter sp. AR 02]MCF3140083.1 DinB family protein [Paenarthrobacter sp. AR 02]